MRRTFRYPQLGNEPVPNVPPRPSHMIEAGALIGGSLLSICAIVLFANGYQREAYSIGIATTIAGTAFAVGRLYS